MEKPKFDIYQQLYARGDWLSLGKKGKELRKKGKYDEALRALSLSLDLNPKPERVLNEIGIIHRLKKNYDEAKKVLKKAVSYNNPPSFNELAIVHKILKEYDKAIEILKSGLEIAPKDVQLLCELGIVFREVQNYSDAVETFEKALKIEFENVRILNELGIVYKEQEKYDKAIEALTKATALGNIQSFNELAIVFKEQEDYDEAIKVLQKGLRIARKDVKLMTELAIVYLEKKDYEKALEVVNDGIRIASYDPYLQSTKRRILNTQSGKKKKRKNPTKRIKPKKIRFKRLLGNGDYAKLYDKLFEATQNNGQEELHNDILVAKGQFAAAKKNIQLIKGEDYALFLVKTSVALGDFIKRFKE